MRQRQGCGELLAHGPSQDVAARPRALAIQTPQALALARTQIRRKTHHDPQVKLLDKADFFWVCLLGSTRPISLLVHLCWFLILKDAVDVGELGRLLARFLVMGSRGGHVVVGKRLMDEKIFSLRSRPCVFMATALDHRRERGKWGETAN